jgi:hypothetical protein
MEEKKVTVVNHGNVFNTGNWYTFYCPNEECKEQVNRAENEMEGCMCGQKIEWPAIQKAKTF